MSHGCCNGSDAEMIGNGRRGDRDRDRDTEEDEDEGREDRSSEGGGGGGFGSWRNHLLGGLTQRVKSWYWGRPLVSCQKNLSPHSTIFSSSLLLLPLRLERDFRITRITRRPLSAFFAFQEWCIVWQSSPFFWMILYDHTFRVESLWMYVRSCESSRSSRSCHQDPFNLSIRSSTNQCTMGTKLAKGSTSLFFFVQVLTPGGKIKTHSVVARSL